MKKESNLDFQKAKTLNDKDIILLKEQKPLDSKLKTKIIKTRMIKLLI